MDAMTLVKRDDAAPGPMLFDLAAPPAPAGPPSPEAVPPMEMDLSEVTAEVIDDPPSSAGEASSSSPFALSADDAAGLPAPPPLAGGWSVKVWTRLLVGGIAVAVATGVGFDMADLLTRAFAVSRGLGWGVAAALAGAGLGLVGLLGREWLGLRRLRRFEQLRAAADRLSRDDAAFEPGGGGAERMAATLADLYADRPDMAAALAGLRLHLPDAHDDRQVLRLVEQELLAPLDAAAYRAAAAAARDAALAAALVPVAILDMLIVLWRNLKLVRTIAALYGVQPGYWASLRLLRHMLGNLAVAGAGEGLHHVAVDALGGSLAASLSTSLGKGVVNGLLTARVGLAAMHFCRPLAFSPDRRPRLSGIRGLLLGLSDGLS